MDSPASSKSQATSQEVGTCSEHDDRHEEIHQIPRREAGRVSLTRAVVADAGKEVSQRGEPNNSESKPSDTSTVRPHFKDQVRRDHDEGSIPMAQGGSSIPLVKSVHIIVNNEDLVPDSATNTQPAEVLPTGSSGINAIVETFKNQPDGAANPPGIQSEDPDTINPPTADPNSQQLALQKHKIWAGSFLFAVVVIAVAVAVILTSGGGGGGSVDSIEKLPPSTSTLFTPPPSIESNTGVPSTLVSTSVPLEPTTDVPTFGNTISTSTVEPTTPATVPPEQPVVPIDNIDSEIKLVSSNGAAGDEFGTSVAIDGNIIVIGASEFYKISDNSGGSAYVYASFGSVWTEQTKLTTSDGAENDSFGISVGIDGNIIVVGAQFGDTENGDDSGSAYVYTRVGSIWTEQAKLTASDGASGDGFGNSVEHVETNKSGGSTYVYTSSRSVWTEQAKLTASDGAENDIFGISVAIDGNTIVIGAQWGDTENGDNSGSAYVYTRCGSIWTEQAKLISSDSTENDFFGNSVAIDEDTIVIGASEDDTENGTNSGSAYVYTRSGTVWTEQIKLTASDGAAHNEFGYSVAIDGGTIVIGADEDDTENGDNSGSVYLYTRLTTVWTEQMNLIASDGSFGDYFGNSVAIDENTIVIGAGSDDTENGENSGSVYIFE